MNEEFLDFLMQHLRAVDREKVEQHLLNRSWYNLRFVGNRVEVFAETETGIESRSNFEISSMDAVRRIVDLIAAEVGVRINESEPIFERQFRGYVVQAAVVPAASGVFLHVVRAKDLVRNYPNTKLPA
jgi:Flp pilus assembly CpaF family ATPase